MIGSALALTLLTACPRSVPDFAELDADAQWKIRSECKRVDEDPAYLGRLRSRRGPFQLELGIGNAVAQRDTVVFGGPSVRLATTVSGIFVAVDGTATFSPPGPRGSLESIYDSQTGGLTLGVPITLGEWLFRPAVTVSGIRQAGESRAGGWVVRGSVAGSAGAELLLPSRAVGLGIDAGFVRPISARVTRRFDRARELWPHAHLGAVLTWYVL